MTVLNSLSFIAEGIHTLDNRRPDMQATNIRRMITTTLETAISETVMVTPVEDWAGVCDVVYLFICFVIGMRFHLT